MKVKKEWTVREAKTHIILEALRCYGFAPRYKDITLIYWSKKRTLFTINGKKYCLTYYHDRYLMYRVLD